VADIDDASMTPSTPYSLPFVVRCQPDLAAATRDLTVRVIMARPVTDETAKALNATVLPFLLLLSSGAMAGESIPPWTSTIEDWSDPIVQPAAIEWSLKSVSCDLQAWVMLAQMLLVDHAEHPIQQIEVTDTRHPARLIEVVQRASRVNPYPRSWSGIDFRVDLQRELYKEFTVCVSFVRLLSEDEKERVRAELFAWAPGLINGAYGVAPVPPDRCIGFPDPEILFVDHELEWIIRNFKAHTSALEGLVNVVASVSHQVVQVAEFRIE
jgi:hypothetical protein